MNLFQRVAFAILLPLTILIGMLTIQSISQYRINVAQDNNRDKIHAEVITTRLESLERELSKAASLIAEAKDSSQAVQEHDLSYLYDWTKLFHSTFLNKIIITDEQGNVLTRSYDQYRFSDNLEKQLPVKTALKGKNFWGLTTIDGEKGLVFSRPVYLYGEFLVGTVSAYAQLSDELIEYLSDFSSVGIQLGNRWYDISESQDSRNVKSTQKIKTNFYPDIDDSGYINIRFYETEETKVAFTNRIIVIALLVVVTLLTLMLVYQVLSNYVRPYSTLVESFSLIAKKEVNFQQVRKTLAQVSGVKNKEAGRIAQAFTQFTYVIESDILQLEDSAYRDELTGLRNRRYGAKALIWEINRHQRENDTLSVIVADIDHFKIVNDYFGHSYGDEILIAVAQIFRDTCRGADIAIRWGGEEFMVLCPHTDIQGCHTLAEKLRLKAEESIQSIIEQKARETGVSLPSDILPVGTLSLGCAPVKQHSENDQGYEAADRALYIAKKTRNSVVAEDE